ncbi:unnamed protein product [Tilletia controversa]|uniref:Uncharacterized protein n=3 Tax=Tilletia TaxID=13289 RepID=A0A8X7MN60_9BASI|nr:hypothetical protein CF336_g6701 [Tilletia laevis]KAE8187631.1 hypothetical protein CF328_g6854 [Tilletia controversa]KAE8246553.1 hypothetical protein A4X03_0g7247 [Tilletia caries]KAE8188585.1 hypothetical protein CF335_g6858 [Tilletia laevis]KAE8242188.1 hypothetical protein A4X06_0g7149 [Tilletia controversa]
MSCQRESEAGRVVFGESTSTQASERRPRKRRPTQSGHGTESATSDEDDQQEIDQTLPGEGPETEQTGDHEEPDEDSESSKHKESKKGKTKGKARQTSEGESEGDLDDDEDIPTKAPARKGRRPPSTTNTSIDVLCTLTKALLEVNIQQLLTAKGKKGIDVDEFGDLGLESTIKLLRTNALSTPESLFAKTTSARPAPTASTSTRPRASAPARTESAPTTSSSRARPHYTESTSSARAHRRGG